MSKKEQSPVVQVWNRVESAYKAEELSKSGRYLCLKYFLIDMHNLKGDVTLAQMRDLRGTVAETGAENGVMADYLPTGAEIKQLKSISQIVFGNEDLSRNARQAIFQLMLKSSQEKGDLTNDQYGQIDDLLRDIMRTPPSGMSYPGGW